MRGKSVSDNRLERHASDGLPLDDDDVLATSPKLVTSARTRNGFALSKGPPNAPSVEEELAFERASTRHKQSRELWFAASDAGATSVGEKLSV